VIGSMKTLVLVVLVAVLACLAVPVATARVIRVTAYRTYFGRLKTVAGIR
jgi:hypothetical protein